MRLSTKYTQSKYVIFLLFFLLAIVNGSSDGFAQTTATTPTSIQITGAVVQPSVTRLGINLGDQTSYDSGQMVKNLVFGNAGFEPMRYRSVLQCVTVSSNTCLDVNTFNPQPTGFWTNATYKVLSGAQAGVTGTILASVSNPLGGPNQAQQLVTFDKSVGLAANDYILVTNSFPGDAQEGWATTASGAATFASETADLSPDTVGTQALRVTATGAKDAATVTRGWDTTNGLTFLQMKGNFALTFRAKGTGGTNQVNIEVNRLTGEAAFLQQTVTLTNAWANYSLPFTANENGSEIGHVQLVFQLAQSGMLIDDVAITQTDSDPSNTTAFRDDVVNALKTLHPGTLRMNTTAAIGADLYDQISPVYARYREGAFTNSAVASNIPYGIPEFLQICAAVGADPWLTIPLATSPQEITDFIDYLTGNGSTTYSKIRVAGGQVAPWTSVFSTIHIEFGNETWNFGFLGEQMGYPSYPLLANQVFGAARQAPGFVASKFDLVLSGFAADPNYSKSVLQFSTQHDSIDMAPYLDGTVNAGTTSTLFQGLFAEPEWMDSPGGLAYLNAQFAAQSITSASGTARPSRSSVYETNMGTVQGTISAAQTLQFVPTVGAGIALADHMLQMMRLGVWVQNSYELPGYQFVGSNGNVTQLFGLTVDMGSQNLRRPSFLAETLANTAVQGSLLATVQTGSNPTWNQPLTPDGVQISAAHEIQSFSFLNGTSHSLVLFNLTPSTALPVLFTGVNAPSGSVQVSQLTSANITDTNETSDTVQTTSTTANISATAPYVLPPYSMTVLRWTGPGTITGPAQTAAPVMSLAPGTYSSAQTISMSDTTQGAAIYYTTDGTTPTTSSNLYSGPVTLPLSATINAIGVAPFYTNSTVTSSTYTIQIQNINFSSGFGAAQGKMVLNGSAVLNGSGLLLTNGGFSQSGTAWYSVPSNVQSFTNNFTFQLTNAQANGFTFTMQNQGTTANGMFGSGLGYQDIPHSVAIKFDLFNAGGEGTDSTGIFTNGVLPTVPSVNLSSTGINLHSGDIMAVHMVYNGTNLVMTITDTVTKAVFTTSFPINIPSVIGANSALVGFTGGTGGATATQNILTWDFTGGSNQPVTATPVFSLAAGTYTTAQTVTIADATSGAAIYYTTNGAVPTTASTKYTGAIAVSSTETLEAIAVAANSTNSSVAATAYTITPAPATPVFALAAGTYPAAQTVAITDATAGASIYYTTNGTTPTIASTLYTGPITVSSTETLEAIAAAPKTANVATAAIPASSTDNSRVAVATYTITSTATQPVTAISFPSGFAAAKSSIVFNGSAVLGGTTLQLTNGGANQQGTAWYATPVNVQSFTTDFTFHLTNPSADGFTFAIQRQGTSAEGFFGPGLGYEFIPKSVAVKFDLFNNAGEGVDSTGLFTNGAIPTVPAVNLSTTGINLHSGDTMTAHLVYNGTVLTMTLTDTVTKATYTTSFTINIPATVGNDTAYVGFTGGTGGASSTQQILAWTFGN